MDGTIDFIILEHDDVAGCALIAGAVDGVVPAIDGYNTPYVVAKGYDHATRNWEDCTLFDDIVKAKLAYEGLRGREYSLDGNMRRDGSATSEIRGFTDAELAIEIEKAGAAMVEHVDAHMAHVHDLGGGEDDSAAYYAARKRYSDLRLEKDRRLRASIDRGRKESPREPQAMAAAAAKAALDCDGAELGRGGKKTTAMRFMCPIAAWKTAPRSDSPSARFRPRQSSTNPSPSRRSTGWVGKSSFAWTVSMRISVKSVPSPAHRPSSALSSTPFAPISRHLAIRSGSKSATSRPTCAKSRSAASASRTRSTRPRRPRRRRAPHSAARRRGRYIEGIRTSN